MASRVDLGWVSEEFLDSTPRMFRVAHDRYEANQAHEDFRAGIIASVVANVNRADKSKPLTPADFFPSLKAYTEIPKQTWQQQLDIVKMLNAAFGGRKISKKGA